MQLKEIKIFNFRSIMDETIRFNHNCMILVGKNEAGKSNSLKAVAAVFGKFKVKIETEEKKLKMKKLIPIL